MQLASFSQADAVFLGQLLLELATARRLPAAIDIRKGRHILFHVSLPGATPDNAAWIKRKSRTAWRYGVPCYWHSICCSISYSLPELVAQMGIAMSLESNGPSVPRDDPPATPHILELRIHGVRETPPWDVLGVPHGDAVMVSGDELGSFWIPKTPTKDAGLPPQFGSEVPNNVRREAYSWGAMARYAPVPGANLLGKSAAVIRRVGWLMMLPFALCNAAYWMRPLARKPKAGDGEAGVAAGRGWRDANGGGIVRVFGLFLTLLLVASATAASVDLIGNQCVRSGEICSTLPGLFNGLTALDQPKRNVVLAILPLAMLGVIYALSVLGRVRYAANVAARPQSGSLPAGPTTTADAASPGRPILQTKGFWYSPMMPRATELLHLSGAGALVVAMLAWDALYSPVPGCRDISTFFTPPCGVGLSKVLVDGGNPARTVSAIAAGRGSFIVLLVAVAILIAVTCRILVSVTGNADVAGAGKPTGKTAGPVWRRELRWAASLLGLVVALGLVNAGLLWFRPESSAVASASTQQGPHFLGVFWTPGLLTLAMLGMSLSGLGWRRGAGTAASLLLFAGSAACFIAGCLVMKTATHRPGPAGLPAGLFVVAALLLAWMAWRVLRKRDEGSHNREGWRGMGPGVVMTIALGVALALSSALVVGTANFLNGKLSLTGGTAAPVVWRKMTDGNTVANGPAPMVTEVPVFDQYGLALIITVIVVVLILAWVLCSQLFGKLFVLSTPDPNSMPTEGVTAGRYPDGRPQPSVPPIGSVARRVLEGRRTAALLHRVEHSIGWLAGTFLVGLMGSLAWSLVQPSIAEDGAPTRSLLTQGMSSAVLGIIALALVGGIVASAASSTLRPAGVLWDLMCFLPNAAHPFGPPCYAERVVPELCARIEEWLDFEDAPEPHRKVVLSAHSLGGVLAVACLFARQADGKDSANIGLLTYGCQLRAYFGRFFPELFGPTVLGTPESAGASLWAPDPWQKQVEKDYDTTRLQKSHPQSLSQLLTTPGESLPRWINLWRRTDFLGFPVKSYAGNEIDRGADELDTSSYMLTLATHSNYPSSRAYPSAMAELLKRMGEPEV